MNIYNHGNVANAKNTYNLLKDRKFTFFKESEQNVVISQD